MTLYNDKYRVESARLKNWDYSSNGFYFITFCTRNRECILGQIRDVKIELSEIGKIVETEWLKSFEIRSELFCDSCCIMPNHIHSIVVIDKNNGSNNRQNDIPIIETHEVETHKVETHGRASLRQREKRSISSFVAGFKSAVTKKINESRNALRIPVWQPRFYDRIIRNEKELHGIREYIINNPKNWDNDENNQSHLNDDLEELKNPF